MSEETIFYQDKGVTVTNARAIIDGKTFAMANVTSVTMLKESPKLFWPIAFVVVGLLLALSSILQDSLGSGLLIVGILLAIAGGIVIWQSKATYIVVLGSASGETRALKSKDQSYVSAIVQAMNDAIIHRG